MKSLRVSLVSMLSGPGHVEHNIDKMSGYLQKASDQDARLVVFPECCLSGYDPANAGRLALDRAGEEIGRIEEEADRLGLAVCFGYLERTGEEELPAITQELFYHGKMILYRKVHLGSREEQYIKPGKSFPVMDILDVRMGMQLCWESHIPDISTVLRGQGAQLLLVPYANGMSGERCRENWMVHLPARASDNGVFLVACNALFPGKDGSVSGGGLAVFDPKGRLLTSYFGKDEHLLTCDLSGKLPREYPEGDMHHISYFGRRKPDLY